MSNVARKRFIDRIFIHSWWVILFLAICYIVFDHNIKAKNSQIAEIKQRIANLQKEKKMAALEKEDLISKINSQSDPEWIETVLIKELGVVPQGQLKVQFKQ
ncbi:MAG: hypothetical protein HZB76_05595 [Chlamydiae bacterium]|nr:hypothetical protein [Chlamydiota bacterium]